MRESYRVVVPDRFLTTSIIDEMATIRYRERVIIETDQAVRLKEGERPPVTYVPMAEINGATLHVSGTAFHCRWKGDATYYDVHLSRGEVIADGAWGYLDAPDEIALLQTRIAFDTTQFNEHFTSELRGSNEQAG